ncbi:MAG: efflux RND transporter periplasmic adaptor subunit [Planctomyces sp.]|jgi:HlyD family secretion protein|nr:efflux RND transporter periplasmic adaptor subunit [Planctomyces sp.]
MLMEFSKLATASLLLLTLSGCQTQTDPAAAADAGAGAGAGARAAELPRVQTGRPQRKGIVQSTEQPGQVRAWLQVEIYPRSGGIVEQVLVDIGNVTEPGQLLAVLTAPELEDELRQKQALQRQAEAEIGQAAAAVQLAMATEHSAEADEAEAAAGRRRIESEVARLTSESQRLQGLAESGAVTLRLAEEAVQKLAAAESSLEELAAAVRSAAARRGEARAACIRAEADLKAMEARRDSAAAEVQRLQTLCGYLQIRAPFAGTVTARNADPGDLARAGQGSASLFTVAETSRVRVTARVPEADAVRISPGSPATVRIPALQQQLFSGTVSRTSWTLDEQTRTLLVEIDLENSLGTLRPGMYASVELIVGQNDSALVVPKGAVIQQDGVSACLAVGTDGVLQKKPVNTGLRTATEIEIVSGLSEDDLVITANTAAYREGQKVESAVKSP